MKVKIWIYIKNNGDGSCSARFFSSEKDAQFYAKDDDERNTDDIYQCILKFDDNGKLLNPHIKEVY